MFPGNGSHPVTPPFPRVGPGRAQFPTVIGLMKALRLPAHAIPVTYLFRFRAPRVSSSVRARLAALPCRWRTDPGPGNCSTGCPLAGVLSRGREWDLTGSLAIHLMPLPRSKTPAGSTPPHHDGVVDAAPARTTAKAPALIISRLRTRLQHLLPTLQERRCHRPCKARFRLAGWPLPGGRRTLWIAVKGFRTPCSFSFPGLALSQNPCT